MGKLFRWLGITLAAVAALLALVLVGIYVVSSGKLDERYAVQVEAVPIPTDSASVERGRHLATAVSACVDCHGEDLAGTTMIEDAAFATVAAPNLTPAGVGGELTDTDWVRAIRHGVARDGRSLIVMPSEVYYDLSDADLGAVIAYAKTVPPATREPAERRYGPISRMLLAMDKLPIFAARKVAEKGAPFPAPPSGVTREYGEYLAHVGGCLSCHGPGLSGGAIPDGDPSAPPASNLTPEGIGQWTLADFTRALREGRRPAGTEINAFMPWRVTRNMTDNEIRALWLYLQSVPPKPYGDR